VGSLRLMQPFGAVTAIVSRLRPAYAPKMPRGDATTQKWRTTHVQVDPLHEPRYTVPDAQNRGTEDAFPMRRELVLDDSYEISPLASMSLGVGMQ
jgi:hypothetical protein